MKNLLTDIPAELPEEFMETLVDADSVRIERIISLGHTSPDGFWYDQAQQEWVVLLTGAACLRFEDKPQLVEMNPGNWVTIPAHQRHRVEWTAPNEPTIWLAVHYSAVG